MPLNNNPATTQPKEGQYILFRTYNGKIGAGYFAFPFVGFTITGNIGSWVIQYKDVAQWIDANEVFASEGEAKQ